MALYIRDMEVDQLVSELQQLRHTTTKTEVVKNALKKEIAAAKSEMPLVERIRPVLEKAEKLGFHADPDFDMKKFMDEQWGDA